MSVFNVSNMLEPVILFYFGTSKGFLGGGVLLVSISQSWTMRACVLAQVSMGPTIVLVRWAVIGRVAFAEWLFGAVGGQLHKFFK